MKLSIGENSKGNRFFQQIKLQKVEDSNHPKLKGY